METQLSQITPTEPTVTTDGPSDGADVAVRHAGSNVTSIEIADAHGVLTDESGDFAALSERTFPTIHADDFPSPAFHDDDLPTPSFHDDDLPTPSFHDDDLPADLTTMGLNRLLGLQLSGLDLPTVGEATRASFRNTASSEAEPEEAEPEETEPAEDAAESPAEEGEASPQFTNAGDLSFIDPTPFTEQAEGNRANFGVDDESEAELFGTGFLLPDADEIFAGDIYDPGNGEPLPSSGGGSGGGTNVINGTAGNDNLIGTGGTDALHGFAGNDFLDGGAGSDRLDGGLGNDVLVWDAADASIDGKNGTDTLRVDSVNADFTSFGGTISDIEIVDLQIGAGAYSVTLTAQDVLDMTDSADTLTVAGDAADSVDASNGWTYAGVDGFGNDIYTQVVGSQTATLVVDPTISVNANILL